MLRYINIKILGGSTQSAMIKWASKAKWQKEAYENYIEPYFYSPDSTESTFQKLLDPTNQNIALMIGTHSFAVILAKCE